VAGFGAAAAGDISPNTEGSWCEARTRNISGHRYCCYPIFIYIYTWWLIPLSKWVITPVINGISRVNPLITGVITHLLSGMSHQVYKYISMKSHLRSP
jgi:hypothetical protein